MQASENNRGFYGIGIDVGGTNTDAVILEYLSKKILNFVKVPTTKDFYTGILQAIKQVIVSQNEITEQRISTIMIGTTAFLNAIIQCSNELSPITVIRLCGSSSRAYPPFTGFPEKLKQNLLADFFMVDGGYEFNKKDIAPLNEIELHDIACRILKKAKETHTSLHLVVSGIFSPICGDQEERVKQIFCEEFSKASFNDYTITLSYKIAQLGLLEREAASILNASLKNMANRYIGHLKQAIYKLNLLNSIRNIYFTSNDGTLISCEDAMKHPILTFNSGPTNSLRGASELCNIKDALVIDIGGTTSDIAVLQNGFPRAASSYVEVGGVRTNFRIPDTLSIGLGGGSIVKFDEESCSIGPVSVGYKLTKEAQSFGGTILTASDIALASGIAKIEGADPAKAQVTSLQIQKALREIIQKIETLVDRMKTSNEPLPLILVGGGSILIPEDTQIEGVSRLITPSHFAVANAVGAAIAQVSGIAEAVINLEGKDRPEEFEKIKQRARERSIERGAIPDSIEVIVDEVHLAYVPGQVVRITCKAIGNLDVSKIALKTSHIHESSMINNVKIDNDEIEPFIEDPNKRTPIEPMYEMKPPRIEYNQKEERKEWILSEEDAEYISIGAGILGAGGGGSPYLGKIMLQKIIKEGKRIRVISPRSLRNDEFALPLAGIGAPFVACEKLWAGNEAQDIVKEMISHYEGSGKKLTCLSSVEIGGINSIYPLCAGGVLDIPVVDIDFMGRAFPEYQMTTRGIYRGENVPVCIGNERGNYFFLTELKENNPKEVENFLRMHCMNFGCTAVFCCPAVSQQDIHEIGIKNSISRAWRLGKDIALAKKKKVNLIKVIEERENGELLFIGKIIDMHRITKDGFNFGELKIQGFLDYKDRTMEIKFQNENIIAYLCDGNKTVEKKCVGAVPDLISLVEIDSYQPILTEDLKMGLRVSVFYLPASPLLKTQQALEVVGIRAFGYQDMAEIRIEREHIEVNSVVDEY